MSSSTRLSAPSRQAVASPSGGAGGGRAKVTDAIVEALRQDIVTGRLEKGSRLPTEKDLAAHFGVSQPTIREAVRALDVMGLVDVRHGSGAYVRGDGAYLMATALQTLLQIENVSLLEALDVREVLGRESVKRACREATDGDVEALRSRLAALGELDRGASVEDVIDRIASFQVAVSNAAHNPLLFAIEAFLIDLILQIQVKAMRRRGGRFWSDRSIAFQGERAAIVDAIAARDVERSVAAMERYLEHQRRVFVSDPAFSEMRLSNAKAVVALADLVTGARQKLMPHDRSYKSPRDL